MLLVRWLPLFGKNSSGKCNILQALQLFWGCALTSEDFYYGETDRTISVSVSFAVAPDEILPFLLHMFLQKGFFSCALTIQKQTLRENYIAAAEMNLFPERKLKLPPVKIGVFLRR